jgi:hypothetical protein
MGRMLHVVFSVLLHAERCPSHCGARNAFLSAASAANCAIDDAPEVRFPWTYTQAGLSS